LVNYDQVMEVTVQEAKTHLSRLLRRVEAGESVVIKRGRYRVALLTAAPPESPRRQIWGDLEGRLGPDFDDIPDDLRDYAS
jgi:prevent-host-death family protein